MIEICAVGGYNEVGKNCTAVKVDDEVVILDLGLHLENYIKFTEDREDMIGIGGKQLMKAGAVPNIETIEDWKGKVKAIVIGHGHLDHVGAVPYLADSFKAPIICTQYTAAIINTTLKDEKIKIRNRVITLSSNSHYKISENIRVEFIHVTHSIPQTVIVAIHTKHGIVVYANDFKFDLSPVFGKKPNFKRLGELGKENVLALIVESTYAGRLGKMPSENIAKEMLKDVLLGVDAKNKAILITTFSSHIARLKSIMEFGKKLNRKILFLGRSLSKYVKAGESIGIINFTKDVELVKYSKQIKKRLKKIGSERGKYLLVVTGHQGEPKSVLAKIVKNEIPFDLHESHVIFSCRTIPTPTNIENREKLEENLKSLHVRIFKDIHESGHAAREDLRDLINLVKPKNIIPAHGAQEMKQALISLANEIGYKTGRNIFLIKDGQRVKL